MSSVITLTTDFGADSPYVAQLKGVMLSIVPEAKIVDLTHSIPPQDIRRGALVLDETTRWFPPGSIHVAVVDPGVGTVRAIVYARFGQQNYIAPDNGLLSRLARRSEPSSIIALTRPEYWLDDVSTTFHGRDILAPVAARLAMGLAPERLGTPQTVLVQLDWPEVHCVAGKISATIASVDSFGNLITDITSKMLADVPRDGSVTVRHDSHETTGICATYADRPEMTLIAVIGSNGCLELAIVGQSAAVRLGAAVGEKVEVVW